MPGTRRFFFALFACSLLLVAGVMAVSLRPAPADEPVMYGWDVWQRRECSACHTLFGHGSGFASDLTRFDVQTPLADPDPAAWHSSPTIPETAVSSLADEEIAGLRALLDWAAASDVARGWPPLPLDVPLFSTPQQAGSP